MEHLQNGSIHCTTKELAVLWGIHLRTVQRLTQEGIINKLSSAKNAKFDLQDSTTRYIKYLQDKATGKEVKQSEAGLKEKKLLAETALKESQAELHKMKTEIAAGKYLSVEEVKLDYAKFFVIFKKFAQGMAGRTMSYINGYIDPVEASNVEAKLTKEIDNLLRGFVVAGMKEGVPDSGEPAEQEEPTETKKTTKGSTKKKSSKSKK